MLPWSIITPLNNCPGCSTRMASSRRSAWPSWSHSWSVRGKLCCNCSTNSTTGKQASLSPLNDLQTRASSIIAKDGIWYDVVHSCLFRYGFHRVESSYLTILDHKKVAGLFKRLRNYPSPNGRTKRSNGDGTVSPQVEINLYPNFPLISLDMSISPFSVHIHTISTPNRVRSSTRWINQSLIVPSAVRSVIENNIIKF